jgi:hypothetical protein
MYFHHACEFWEHSLLNGQLDSSFYMQGTFDVSGHLAYCPVGRNPGVLPENTYARSIILLHVHGLLHMPYPNEM